jgi:hypothetical protein
MDSDKTTSKRKPMSNPEEVRQIIQDALTFALLNPTLTPEEASDLRDTAVSNICELVRESVNEKRILPITKEYPVFKNALEYSDHVVAIRDTTRNEIDAKWTLKQDGHE